MKSFRIFIIASLIAVLGISGLTAQSAGASSLKGMSLNGATGLYSIPTGRIGWEQTSNFGLDFGYHTIIDGDKATHLPKLAMSLFKWVEFSAAFDIQPDGHFSEKDGSDFITGIKIQFPLKKTALALGGNFQLLNMSNSDISYKAGQIYLAVTYAGNFFDWPSETTVVLGKTFIDDNKNSNIDFGMGFDLMFLPQQLDGLVHWILDFSNFSYSVEAFGADSWSRGVLNTGLRIDMSRISPFNKFKFVIDILVTDAFDTNRAFSAGVVFGVPIL